MNLRTVLERCGAEDIELDHLVTCDLCSVEPDLEGMWFERCPANPERLRREAEKEQYAQGHALMAAFGIPRQPSMSMALAELMGREYAEMMRAQLDLLTTPLFARLGRS